MASMSLRADRKAARIRLPPLARWRASRAAQVALTAKAAVVVRARASGEGGYGGEDGKNRRHDDVQTGPTLICGRGAARVSR